MLEDTFVAWIVCGAAAGWLVSVAAHTTSTGRVGDIITGAIGAVIGGSVIALLGGTGKPDARLADGIIVVASAIVLPLLVRFLRGRRDTVRL